MAPLESAGHDASEQRLAAIGRRLSGVMHDLTSPLSVASGYVQLMAREASEERRRSYLQRVLVQFAEMEAMSRELLAFAEGEEPLRVEAVALAALAAETEQALAVALASAGSQVVVAATGEGMALTDPLALRRIVSNLTRNAVEAAASRVLLQLIADAEQFRVICDDDGAGIPASDRARVFEAGFSTRDGAGRGFGLALVRELSRRQQGEVEIVESPLGGCRFVVTLPQPLKVSN